MEPTRALADLAETRVSQCAYCHHWNDTRDGCAHSVGTPGPLKLLTQSKVLDDPSTTEFNQRPGIAEFLAEGGVPETLIIAELPEGDVMLTIVNTITHERHSLTLRRTEAHAAALVLRFAARSFRS
jgi:hypothetical protein